jgi:glucan phosphoethanolaminetransferase (alkaline phosphatase superfamily)
VRKKNEARHSYRITVTNIFLLLFSLLLIPAVISIFFPIVFKINLLITAFFIFLFIIEILILFTIKKPEVSSEKNIYKFSLNRDEKLTFKLISPSFLLRSRFKIEMPASFKDM